MKIDEFDNDPTDDFFSAVDLTRFLLVGFDLEAISAATWVKRFIARTISLIDKTRTISLIDKIRELNLK